MEYTPTIYTSPMGVSAAIFSSSPGSSPPLTTSHHGPCAACKILRRRCTESCVLSTYFPATEPLKFVIAHKVFGASNIVKALQVISQSPHLQELPEHKRTDAVSSMVYEASARIRDPVYGCAGAISQLQQQLDDLQAELAMTQAELFLIRCQQHELNHYHNTGISVDEYLSQP